MTSEPQPGDLIEWWCKSPFDDNEGPYAMDVFHIAVRNWREWKPICTHAFHTLIALTDTHVVWTTDDLLHFARLDDVRGGYHQLTGSVLVYPRAMQKTSGSW